MITDKNFRPLVSMSVKNDVRKTPDNQCITFGDDPIAYKISTLEFKNTNSSKVTLETIVTALEAGHCIGQVYDVPAYRRKYKFSFNQHWRGSSWIGVDIDDTIVDMKTMYDELLRKPTFCMTTQSHLKGEHKIRYRLFYFFNILLENYDGFCKVADAIVNDVRRVLQNNHDSDAPIDNITKQKSRFYFGNPCDNCETITSWAIYSPDEFYPRYSEQANKGMKLTKSSCEESPFKEEEVLRPAMWPRLLKSCLNPNSTFDGIVKRYKPYYHIGFKTKVEYVANGCAFTQPPKNYMYLRFRFENKPTINGMKDKVVISKWHNHEHRRRILAAQLELIAYMHNFELTVDQLVFHALYLFHFAYCNNELDGRPCSGNDRITPKDVMDMARVVYQMSKKDIKTLVKAELEKSECAYLVNRAEAEKRDISVLKLLGEARHEYTEYRWAKWIEILMPYIKQGLSNKKLAEILEEETATKSKPGVKLTPKTIGRHVAKFREYRLERVEEDKLWPQKVLKINKLDEKFALFSDSYDSNCSVSASEESLWRAEPSVSFHSPFTQSVINTGGILSQSSQIAVANEARFRDVDQRTKQFVELYNPQLTDKENRVVVTTTMGISDRQYYYLKKNNVNKDYTTV